METKETILKTKKVTKDINKNDVKEKELKESLENELTNTMLIYYLNANIDKAEVEKFLNFLRYRSQSNKSKNNFNNRVFSLYQYLINQYSDFTDLNKIMVK